MLLEPQLISSGVSIGLTEKAEVIGVSAEKPRAPESSCHWGKSLGGVSCRISLMFGSSVRHDQRVSDIGI